MPDLRFAVAQERGLRAMLIEHYPELAEPEHEETLLDTISAAGGALEDQVVAALRWAIERKAQADALGRLVDEMEMRRSRLVEGAERVRRVVLQALQDAGRSVVKAPDMTIAVRRGNPKAMITDEMRLPERFVRTIRKPMVAEITAALRAKEAVPGAELSNGADYLWVGRK